MKISDEGMDADYSLEELPALIHFAGGQPNVFQGDLRSPHAYNKPINPNRRTTLSTQAFEKASKYMLAIFFYFFYFFLIFTSIM